MKSIIVLIFIFVLNNTFGQITFEKGFFILNSNERIECLIKNEDWKNNPNEFYFIYSISDTVSKKETIENVQQFGIYGICDYSRFKLKIERSSDIINKLSIDENPIWKDETLFLKKLIDGDAKLYSFTDQDLYKYFYETKNESIRQLIRIKHFNKNEDDTIDYENVGYNNEFRNQLKNNLLCEALNSEDFNVLEFNKSALSKIFIKYNNSIGSHSVDFVNINKKSFVNIKINSSFNLTKLDIFDPSPYYNSNTNLESNNYKIGFETEWVLPYNKNKWSVFVNPTFQKYSSEKSFITSDGYSTSSVPFLASVKVDYSSIEMPIGVRHYFFINKNSIIFANAIYVIDTFGKSKLVFNNNRNIILESGSRNNAAFGIGYSYKNKYNLEFRINSDRQILSDYISWSAKYSSIGFIIGYKLL